MYDRQGVNPLALRVAARFAQETEAEEIQVAEAEWSEGDGACRLSVIQKTWPRGSSTIRIEGSVSHYGGQVSVELPAMDRRIANWLRLALDTAVSRLGPDDSWDYNTPKFTVDGQPVDSR